MVETKKPEPHDCDLCLAKDRTVLMVVRIGRQTTRVCTDCWNEMGPRRTKDLEAVPMPEGTNRP